MRRALKKACVLIMLQSLMSPSMAEGWLKLAPGIEYQDLSPHALTHWSHIHAFRINLNHNELTLAMADMFSHQPASAHEFAQLSKALIAINGGFFDQKFRPLGLRISHQRQHNPLKYISWWGIFYIKDQIPYISNARHFNTHRRIDFAIQSGPRLLINGKIPSLKPGFAERSALGITSNGHVIIVVTEHTPLSTAWLALLMKSSPLHCTNALNLDGGSSSQLYAHVGHFKINAPSFARVSDAIVVTSK